LGSTQTPDLPSTPSANPLDLALLDTRVTALVQRIQLSLSTGLDASGYDDATVAYLLAAYNNGATLE
jgi:hypothetical protein